MHKKSNTTLPPVRRVSWQPRPRRGLSPLAVILGLTVLSWIPVIAFVLFLHAVFSQAAW